MDICISILNDIIFEKNSFPISYESLREKKEGASGTKQMFSAIHGII